MQTESSLWIWLLPAFAALFLYGVGQGLVKKWIQDVPPARFCLFFVVAKAIVNLSFYLTNDHPPVFSNESLKFFLTGTFAYLLDGIGWILYFESIVVGPITIVGTLSAAYPALTVLFARIFLSEQLSFVQYLGVSGVIIGCLALSYSPPNKNDTHIIHRRWIPMSAMALLLWGAAQTFVKYSYTLPNSSEVSLSLLNTFGGLCTLGVYGIWRGRLKVATTFKNQAREWGRSFLPMAMMAGGDLGVIVASKNGPISIVSPLTGAYPLVTLGFAAFFLNEKITRLQWFAIFFILFGIYFSSGGQ